MNFMGKTAGDSTGSSTSSRRQQGGGGGGGGGGGYSFEEDDDEEKQQIDQLFPSTSPSSSHHHHHHHHQPPSSFFPPPPYHHHHQQRGGSNWLLDTSSSSHQGAAGPLMLDYSSTPAADEAQPQAVHHHHHDDQAAAGGGMMMMVEREHMFDKVVTPSDVGKLNRLVIPKQHAERYFPLDSSTNDKGLLLNFEDRNGKPWRFRYSYWNSSQSYVMTKGWSRFVKDKKLDAGDIVSFQRGVGGSAKDRLFIDWRHRPDAPTPPPYQLSPNLSFPLPPHHHHQFPSFHNRNTTTTTTIHPAWNPLFLHQSHPRSLMLQPPNSPYSYRYPAGSSPSYHNIGTGSVVNVNQGGSSSGGSLIYFRSAGGGGTPHQQQQQIDMMHRSGVGNIDPPPLPAAAPSPPAVVFESVPVVHGKAAAKRLRLFGVNMDCPISEDDDQDYDHPSELSASISSTTNPLGHYHYASYHHDNFPPPPPPSSSSTIPYLQLRPAYGGGGGETQFNQTSSSSTDHALNKTTKSSSSNMSLDLDI